MENIQIYAVGFLACLGVIFTPLFFGFILVLLHERKKTKKGYIPEPYREVENCNAWEK